MYEELRYKQLKENMQDVKKELDLSFQQNLVI